MHRSLPIPLSYFSDKDNTPCKALLFFAKNQKTVEKCRKKWYNDKNSFVCPYYIIKGDLFHAKHSGI
jgi:hypothetical protein